MKLKFIIPAVLISALAIAPGCKNEGTKQPAKNETATAAEEAQNKQMEMNRKKVEELNHQYPRIPNEGQMLESGENAVFNELKQRYKDELTQLKTGVEATGAKFMVIFLSAEVANNKASASVKYGVPAIKSSVEQLGIENFDFAPYLSTFDMKEISQLPKDGHWSKKGAEIIADKIGTFIKKYPDATCKVTYKDTERPETFGDLPPNDDEVLDGGKDLPYHVKANSQGVRMDHDLTFPKKKKRVLLMGDSGLFCPFLDNEFTIAYYLQQKFPDYEIYCVANVSFTIDDYLSLWNDKTKYTEPDMVIIGANGNDIEDLFFTNRNHCARSGKPYNPSPVEEKYYHELFK